MNDESPSPYTIEVNAKTVLLFLLALVSAFWFGWQRQYYNFREKIHHITNQDNGQNHACTQKFIDLLKE